MTNSPLGSSGYSIVAKYISRILQDMGHTVNIFAYWGCDSAHPLVWNGMQLLPRWRDPWGKDIFLEHLKRTNSDILLPIFDVWVIPELEKFNHVVAHSPTDHDPPAKFLENVLKKCWKVIPFTKWSKESMEKVGIKTMDYIPHGIDLNIFKPIDKRQCRKQWSIREKDLDCFMVGIVAGNYDKEGRKRWDKQLEAISIFRKNNPDCPLRVYLHTDVNNYVYGFDINTMVRIFGLDDITYVSDPYYFITQLPYEKMPEIYNMFDVCMMCTSREGFGLPITESQACGVPCLVTDFAAGPEMTHPDLRVKVAAKIFTPILSWTAVPDAEDAAKKLEMLWKDKEKREFYSKWSLENIKQYDWNGPLVRGRWIKAMDIIQDELNKEKNQPTIEVIGDKK